ncbi:MAG: response regulator transcription factor [Cyanothece sp. SIO1E1]|nr:response regulator transcription factor [Cyanothece sp. SIO1E1]
MIRVLLVDDQSIIRQGLQALLELEPDLQVVGDAEHGQAAILKLVALQHTPLQPEVVLMDIRMPVMDGVAATKAIRQQFPEIKVLVLTTFDQDELVTQALQVGAIGYLLKDTPSEELANAIRAVHKGYTQFGPGIFQKLMAHRPSTKPPPTELPPGFAELTPREQEVLKLIATGASNREIAQQLYISEGTVKNYVTSILGRLNLRDRTQAAIFANSIWHQLEINPEA